MSRHLSLHHFGLMQPEQSFHGAHNGNEGVETQGFLLLSANNCSPHRHGYIYPPRQQSSSGEIVETSCEYGPLYDTLPWTSFNPNQSEPPMTLPSTIKLNISLCIVGLVGQDAQKLKLFLLEAYRTRISFICLVGLSLSNTFFINSFTDNLVPVFQ